MTTSTPPPASPAPRRIATPGWLDLRLVLGVVLVLAAVLIGAVVFTRADRTEGAVATRRALAAGTVLTADDLTTVQVRLPDRQHAAYLSSPGKAVGKRLQRAVAAGELVPADSLGAVTPGTTLTVPFAAGSAPDLRTGQRIEVWVSSATCSSVVLLPEVTVQSVRRSDDGTFGSGDGGQSVVVDVAPALANRVIAALAIDDVKLRAGVLTGATVSSAAPSALPDLAPCAAANGTR